MYINRALAAKRNISQKDIEKIKKARVRIKKIMKQIQRAIICNDLLRIKKLTQVIEKEEFTLQKLWGFPLNKNTHTYWIDNPACSCPRGDNRIVYPKYRVHSTKCLIHSPDITKFIENKIISESIQVIYGIDETANIDLLMQVLFQAYKLLLIQFGYVFIKDIHWEREDSKLFSPEILKVIESYKPSRSELNLSEIEIETLTDSYNSIKFGRELDIDTFSEFNKKNVSKIDDMFNSTGINFTIPEDIIKLSKELYHGGE